jgi:hypothetical protein
MKAIKYIALFSVALFLSSAGFPQTCTLNTEPTHLRVFISLIQAAWNAARGDPKRREELQSIVSQSEIILAKKSRLIDACDTFQKSGSDQDWGNVSNKLGSLNSALTALSADLDDQIASHPRDGVGNALDQLRQYLQQKMKDICGLDAKPATEDQKRSYGNLVERMKRDRRDLQEATADLKELASPPQGG